MDCPECGCTTLSQPELRCCGPGTRHLFVSGCWGCGAMLELAICELTGTPALRKVGTMLKGVDQEVIEELRVKFIEESY